MTIDKIVSQYEMRLHAAQLDTSRAQAANAELRETVMRLKARIAELVLKLQAKRTTHSANGGDNA